jgi:hypothetical protein
MLKLTFVGPSFTLNGPLTLNVIPLLKLCQNNMLDITHAIFAYKQIMNW